MIPAEGVGALINYSRPIDKYTRFMFYSHYSRTEYLTDDEFEARSSNTLQTSETPATHVIVLVNWGIDAVVVLQLPSDDELIAAIDVALNSICVCLTYDQPNSALIDNEKHLLERIVRTEVFSNIPDLTSINSIIDFYRTIPQIKDNSNLLKPYNYNLCSIDYLYPPTQRKKVIFNEINVKHIDDIEYYLVQLSIQFKIFKAVIGEELPNSQRHLKRQFHETFTQWSNLKEKYSREFQRFRDLVIDSRKVQIDESKISQALSSNEKDELQKGINDFTKILGNMKEKEHFISDLLQQQFGYLYAVDRGVKDGDDDQALERKLLTDKTRERIICSDDILIREKRSQWHTLYGQLLRQRDENPQLRFVYVNFSYCSFKLNDFKVLPMTEKNPSAAISKSMPAVLRAQSINHDTINILLLGESGVGKSTFINALINYLNFNTFKKAQSNKPIVLIPVSFIMTINDNFDERVVTFGELDSLSNEDYEHSGGSVTQHCKSYVFNLGDDTDRERKLRIIDTPGIGDVRGVDQDDINMQHVLSYINNLTHLNAVCILMKPNNARLNTFFHSCFTQLFDFLGEDARTRIIFCFTNARESFRYLVASEDGIQFDDSQKEEYKDSWMKSSAESQRFLQHIRTDNTVPLICSEHESIKQAQLRIGYMIRPMLEAMRNILRNIVLWNAGSRTISIELCPKIIKSPAAICFACPRESQRVGDFWITADRLHFFLNKCRTCSCPPDKHISINYELEYKLCNYASKDSDHEMTNMLDNLCQASAEFAVFLLDTAHSLENDPFLSGLKRMIKEEDDIRANKRPCHLNSSLFDEIQQLKTNYEDARKKMAKKKEHKKLSEIYVQMDNVSKYRMMESQLAAVQRWQKLMIKYYECEVQV